MIRIYSIFIFLILSNFVWSQGLNQRSIVINNNDNANYVNVKGVPIKILPSPGFVISTSFFGFTHPVAGSSIVITDLAADVSKSFLSFSSKELLKTGVVADSETMYKINGFEAMLVRGKQSAHGHIYNRLLLIVGNRNRTILLNASFYATSSEKHAKEVEDMLLSVIFTANEQVDPLERFDFSINVEGTILKPGNMMLTSMVYTDDGNVPSRSENPISIMIRKTKNLIPLSEQDQITLCEKLMELYPIEWLRKEGLKPKKLFVNGLQAYEMFGIGTNKQAFKNEMIYQLVVFDKEYYYVITGITGDKFNENLRMFRRVARTLKTN